MNGLSEQDIAGWYPRLFRTALRLTGSEHDAGDLTQQAFYKALSNWHRFEFRSSPLTWLHAILMNCIRDHLRRQAVRQTEPLDEWALSASLTFDECAAENASAKEELAELRKAVKQLSPTLRQTFVATVLDGYTYQQAADMLSVPVGTISSRVCQARRELTSAMRELYGDYQRDRS